jgi:ABC-type sugar transport system substrate-binding protein
MTKLVTEAKIPLVYVNLQPAEETLPKGAAYVGSPEIMSGKLQGEAIAKRHHDGRACDTGCRSAD